eukprot:533333-Amphidinium_carterae.1
MLVSNCVEIYASLLEMRRTAVSQTQQASLLGRPTPILRNLFALKVLHTQRKALDKPPFH